MFAPRNRLFVIVPAQGVPNDYCSHFVSKLKQDSPAGSVWLHYAVDGSQEGAFERSINLAATIRQTWQKHNGFSSVTLVGHADGAHLIRGACLLAAGVMGDPKVFSHEWSEVVTNVVFIDAPINGTQLPWHLKLVPDPLRKVLAGQYAYDLLTGAKFLNELQIAWTRLVFKRRKRMTVVNVTTAAQLNRARDEHPVGTKFLILPKDDAGDLIAWLKEKPSSYEDLRRVIVDEIDVHLEQHIHTSASRVVFILHGIRASNRHWITQLQNSLTFKDKEIRVITASYGHHFSILRFLVSLAVMRRHHSQWFQNTYAYYLRQSPDAQFVFIGHSYGTLICGRSLRQLSGIQFSRAALVGSILPESFDWKPFFDRRQVDSVTNYRSARDLPVLWLCSALRGLGIREIGTSGVHAFHVGDPRLREIGLYDGGHSAALGTESLKAIAAFALTGEVLDCDMPMLSRVGPLMEVLGRLSPILSLLVLTLLVGLVVAAGHLAERLFGWPHKTIWVCATVLLLIILEVA